MKDNWVQYKIDSIKIMVYSNRLQAYKRTAKDVQRGSTNYFYIFVGKHFLHKNFINFLS